MGEVVQRVSKVSQRVSIIIPVFNRLRLVKQTLESLYRVTPRELYRLIVVDNGSTDGAWEYLQTIPFIDKLIKEEERGPGPAKNRGVKESEGEYLYISDSDMYFLVGWLETLQKAYQPEIGVLGALGHPWWPAVGKKWVGGEPGIRAGIEVEFAEQQPGYSWFMRREIWDKFGPLVAGKVYGEEDTEFCNRVKAGGYLVGHTKNELILHCGIKRADGSITYGAEDQIKNYPEGVITE